MHSISGPDSWLINFHSHASRDRAASISLAWRCDCVTGAQQQQTMISGVVHRKNKFHSRNRTIYGRPDFVPNYRLIYDWLRNNSASVWAFCGNPAHFSLSWRAPTKDVTRDLLCVWTLSFSLEKMLMKVLRRVLLLYGKDQHKKVRSLAAAAAGWSPKHNTHTDRAIASHIPTHNTLLITCQ